MRIIAGSVGGRRIEAPPGEGTRPTHDRVREAVFSMLGAYFDGGCVLDLFAGSGALGLEALSRGMTRAVFCDCDRTAAKVVEKNACRLGLSDSCRIFNLPFDRALLQMRGETFDLVFLDPPYEGGFMDAALSSLAENKLLQKGARIVCEIRKTASLQAPKEYRVLKQRTYGMAQVVVLEYANE